MSGCFLRYDDFHLDWQSGGFVYGYGTQTVGQGDAYINWQLTGPNNRSNPARFRVTTATVTAHMSGVLSNGAPGVTNGGRVLQGPSIQGFGAAPAGTWRAWPNGGFGARDTTSWDHNVTIEFSWTMSNYPGYWYVWVRSSVSHTTDKQIYRFDQPSQVPGNDYGSGHNS